MKEVLLKGIAKKYRKDDGVRNRVEQSTREMLKAQLAYVRVQKRNENGSRLIQSFLMQHFTKDQLDYVQDQAGIPQEEHVSYSATAQNLHGDDNIGLEELTSSNGVWALSQVSDEVVMNAVGCIVKNCDIKSWGEKTVPIGDSTSIAITSLTHKCGLKEMWEKCLQCTKDEEKVNFLCILRHDGPFRSGHKHFKGSAFNLLILWVDGLSS